MEGGREGEKERGRKHLFIFNFCLREKNETQTRRPGFYFFGAKKFPLSVHVSVHASERHCFDTASTLLQYTHTHTRHLYTTHTHILEISTWCCERNPLSSSSYPHLYLSTDRQTKPNQTDQTQHDTSTINPVTNHCTNLLSSDSKAAETDT